MKAARAKWSRNKRLKGKGWEYAFSALPPETQAAILANEHAAELKKKPARKKVPGSYSREGVWAHFDSKPDKHKQRGINRAKQCRAVAELVAEGMATRAAIAAVAEAEGCERGTLRNVFYKVKNHPVGDWAAILTPGYVGRRSVADVDADALAFFKSDYLRLEAPPATVSYDLMRRAAEEHGWVYPSLATMLRMLRQALSPSTIVLAREGRDGLLRMYPAQRRDRSVLEALEAVNADGHRFNVFVEWEDGTIGRALMLAWQDLYSGKRLAWRVTPTESADTVRLSFGRLVDEFGLPTGQDGGKGHVTLDNGRGFAAKWITGGAPTRYRFKVRDEDPVGVLEMCGQEVHWATPYHGQAKPIERSFQDDCDRISKHPAFAGAYTGANPMAKPENYAKKAIPIETFKAILDQEIAAMNARTGRRSEVCNGRSFDDVFFASYTQRAIRKPTEAQRRSFLLAADGVTCSRTDSSITLEIDRRNVYWHAALEDYQGAKLVARFDPQHLHDGAHVYTLDGRYICHATPTSRAGFYDSEAAKAHNRARNQHRKAAKAQLDAERTMTALELAAKLPGAVTAETPAPGAVAMTRPGRPLEAMPVPTETISDAERAALEAEIQAARVVALPQSAKDKYRYWLALDRRLEAGDAVTKEEHEFHAIYSHSMEWLVEKEMHDDFGAAYLAV